MSGSFKTITFEGRDITTKEDELGKRPHRVDRGSDGNGESDRGDSSADRGPREDGSQD